MKVDELNTNLDTKFNEAAATGAREDHESRLDRGLDQGVEFLSKHGFGGAQLKYLFSLQTRQQKFLYIASVAGATVAVTFFSRSLVGRTLRRIPILRWA